MCKLHHLIKKEMKKGLEKEKEKEERGKTKERGKIKRI